MHMRTQRPKNIPGASITRSPKNCKRAMASYLYYVNPHARNSSWENFVAFHIGRGWDLAQTCFGAFHAYSQHAIKLKSKEMACTENECPTQDPLSLTSGTLCFSRRMGNVQAVCVVRILSDNFSQAHSTSFTCSCTLDNLRAGINELAIRVESCSKLMVLQVIVFTSVKVPT